MQPGNRVILNTAILYAKMVVSILVGLISTRLVLKALGVENYGIYNLVAGVVSMLAFLNTSLAASTQRFLSFSLGKQDVRHLKKIFYYSLILHIGIGVCVILLIETVGIYGIKHVLTIAPDKISNTLSILHLLSCSVFFFHRSRSVYSRSHQPGEHAVVISDRNCGNRSQIAGSGISIDISGQQADHVLCHHRCRHDHFAIVENDYL